MKKIMIDMDDVICEGGFLRLVNQFLHTNYQKEDIKSYYIQDIIPVEKQEEWKEFFANQNVYESCQFLPGAYEAMEKLKEEYELYIATAYIFKENEFYSSFNLKNKYEWLYQKLPFIKPEQYVFISNKEILNCEIKIDDKISNLKGDAEMKLLFDSYHNHLISEEELKKEHIERVCSWQEIEKKLLK